ncbi:MAG TPA: TrbG/VirB9 family P-type conjugative transfer protein [Noviherbaspirillum sp.]
MRASVLLLALACLGVGQVQAAQGGVGSKYLTAEDAILEQSKSWRQTGVAKPILSDDGRILYPFGQYMPTLICSTFHVCLITLEKGEAVQGTPSSGDTRVTLTPTLGGPDKDLTVITVKPTAEDFDTNFAIVTDRRIYQIKFISAKKEAGDYVQSIGFYYPEDMKKQWDDYAKAAKGKQAKREQLVQSEMGESAFDLDRMDFDYKISGEGSFKPSRVFNNGSKTFIQFPESMRTGEAPILVVLDEKEQPISVNFRVKPYGCANVDCSKSQGDMLVVDYVVKRARLVLGKDSDLVKVDIRAKSASSWWQ